MNNEEGGGFQTRKIGNPSAGVCIHNCIPFPVACWFYGFDPKWLRKSGGMCMSKWSGLEDNLEPHSIHRLLRGEIPRLPIGTKLKLSQDRASFVSEPFQDRDGEWKIEGSGPLAEGVKLLAERRGCTPDEVMNDALREFITAKKPAVGAAAQAAA